MINAEISVYLSGLHQIKTRVFVGSVLHITPLQPVLCNVGVSGERELCPGGGLQPVCHHQASECPKCTFYPERESRVRDDNNQDDGRGNIPEMCDAEEAGAGLCPGRQGVKSCVVN